MTERPSLQFAAHGVRLAVTSDTHDVLDAALSYLPPLRTSIDSGPIEKTFHVGSHDTDGTRVWSLVEGDEVLRSSARLPHVLNALEWEVHRFLAERAPDRIFVHAGAVEWRGRAIVVPGRSFSGKSTLVAAFLRAGCTYLSDEYAILDASGRCHAHPRPLSLRVEGRVERHTVQELGGRLAPAPLPVGAIVVTRYRPGARWEPNRLSPGQALLSLLRNTIAIRSRSREALGALSASVAGADAYRSVRGNTDDVVASLLSQCS
jgi:hypothetical protein